MTALEALTAGSDALQQVVATINANLLIWFGIFTRVAALAFLLPGIGERSLPSRVKLGAALALSAIVAPMVMGELSPVPATPRAIGSLLMAEAAAGLFIGAAIRLLIFAIQTAGTIASQSLSVAQMFGGTMGQEPEPVIATFLTLAAIALALAAGLHIKVAMALIYSYQVIPFGMTASGSAYGEWAAASGTALFDLAVGLALPFILIAFLYNLALGAINKAMPQLMVAFVGAPFITGMGIAILMLTAPIILGVWLEHLDFVLANPFEVLR